MDLNRQLLLGRISRQPELRYNAKGTAYCSLTLAIDKPSADGQVYTSWHQVEIIGKFAQDLSVTLEVGDEILVEGEASALLARSTRRPRRRKSGVCCRPGGLQRIPASTSSPADPSGDTAELEPAQEPVGKSRKTHYWVRSNKGP